MVYFKLVFILDFFWPGDTGLVSFNPEHFYFIYLMAMLLIKKKKVNLV